VLKYALNVYIDYYGTIGQVAKIDKQGVWIICGNNKPIILQTVSIDNVDKQANSVGFSLNNRF